MKTFFSIIAILGIFSGLAFADGWGSPAYDHQAAVFQVFSNQSTSVTTSTGTAYDVSKYRYKTVTVQGVAVSGHTNTSLSGTLTAYCGPTSTGPFIATTGIFTTAVGGPVSTTSNATLDWQGACQYLLLGWAKTSGEVSAWVSVGN